MLRRSAERLRVAPDSLRGPMGEVERVGLGTTAVPVDMRALLVSMKRPDLVALAKRCTVGARGAKEVIVEAVVGSVPEAELWEFLPPPQKEGQWGFHPVSDSRRRRLG